MHLKDIAKQAAPNATEATLWDQADALFKAACRMADDARVEADRAVAKAAGLRAENKEFSSRLNGQQEPVLGDAIVRAFREGPGSLMRGDQ